jgi:hypothetical protein
LVVIHDEALGSPIENVSEEVLRFLGLGHLMVLLYISVGIDEVTFGRNHLIFIQPFFLSFSWFLYILPTCLIICLLEKDLPRLESLLAALCDQRFRLVQIDEASPALERGWGSQHVE